MSESTEQDRQEFDPTPSEDYGTLLVQFNGLLWLYNSESATRSQMTKTIMDLRKRLVDGANDSVNSQRAANARLTDEVERLQARVAELEAICENVPEGCTPTLSDGDVKYWALECGLISSGEHWGTVYRAASLSQLRAFADAVRNAPAIDPVADHAAMRERQHIMITSQAWDRGQGTAFADGWTQCAYHYGIRKRGLINEANQIEGGA